MTTSDYTDPRRQTNIRKANPLATSQLTVEVVRLFCEQVGNVNENGCLEWIGPKSKGYGYMPIGGQRYSANRIAWRMANPQAPDPEVVRHTCDNPACVNPQHLLPGTQLDNIDDMVERKRHRRGSNHYRASLTENHIVLMRWLWQRGWKQKDIGKLFGMAQGNVSHVLRGKKWKSAGGTIAEPKRAQGSRNSSAKVAEDQVREIRRLAGSGMLRKDIAAKFGIDARTVSSIVLNQTWRHVT